MPETPRATLRNWLLTAVADLGGSAPRADVHRQVEARFGHLFTADDRLPRVGRPGREEAWRNSLDSLYHVLRTKGLMMPSTRGEPWRISPQGSLAVAPRPVPVEEAELLSDFFPKDSRDYIARLAGRELVKRREHEDLLRSYGQVMAKLGWRPSTTVHPRDLELTRGVETWLVEVKVVYEGNGTAAARAALAQLLEYRHFFYQDGSKPGMLALFSEEIGSAHVGLLRELGVRVAWRTQTGWNGDEDARSAGLVP
ncbi:hypothetical protein ABZV75_04850 [Streptomyces flaveolus]|uniref:hypothetical protein n=1 Tax=Streptomyces flaveolus TaxID=67297 RepID=UPI0033A83C5F